MCVSVCVCLCGGGGGFFVILNGDRSLLIPWRVRLVDIDCVAIKFT